MNGLSLHTQHWTIEHVHSTIGFVVRHMGVSTFRGRFDDVDARLELGETPRLTGVARADSLIVRDPTFQTHLRAEDFFHTDAFPEITFASGEMTIDGDEVTVSGELTIKDHTRTVTAHGHFREPLDDPFGGTRLGLDLETEIDRRDYGIDWNMPLPGGRGAALANEVRLVLNLEFTSAH